MQEKEKKIPPQMLCFFILKSCCPKLEHLDLACTKVNDIGISHFQHLVNLKELEIDSMIGVSPKCLRKKKRDNGVSGKLRTLNTHPKKVSKDFFLM